MSRIEPTLYIAAKSTLNDFSRFITNLSFLRNGEIQPTTLFCLMVEADYFSLNTEKTTEECYREVRSVMSHKELPTDSEVAIRLLGANINPIDYSRKRLKARILLAGILIED